MPACANALVADGRHLLLDRRAARPPRGAHRARPRREMETGNGCTSSGSIPDSANSVVSRGPTCGSTTSPRPRPARRRTGALRRTRPCRRQRAVPVPGGVVRLHGEDASTRARDAGELAQRFADVGDVLEDGDAERRVERRVGKRQMAGVGGAERGAQVVAAGRALGDDGALHEPVDADQRDLRDAEPRQPQLDAAGAAADVEDAVAGAGAQPLDQERGEGLVPPVVANVLERCGSQRIERARRSRHGRLIYHWQSQPRIQRDSRAPNGRA